MLSRLLGSTLEKLTIKDTSSSPYPTLSFPPPPPTGLGTSFLCPRCLTILSHIIAHYGDGSHYGDGTEYGGLEIIHSTVMPDAGKLNINIAANPNVSPPCVICIKTIALFEAMRNHISFEKTLRKSSGREWSVKWKLWNSPAPGKPEYPSQGARVCLTACHRGGYGWGIGDFTIYPGWTANNGKASKHNDKGDYPVIVSLDPKQAPTEIPGQTQPELDFSSTVGSGSWSLITSWAQDCAKSHKKCQRIFGSKGISRPAPWFPDRLLRVRQEGDEIFARVVVKSNSDDFSQKILERQLSYLSLSHCWGPAPDISAPMGGRAGTVLTEANLPAWQKDVPLDDLPLTFQHAVLICSLLGFEHIWIDSLCILQDSVEDWQSQSAVMGDVYKFAWLNIAALSSSSDYDGFINNNRDPRVEFGFRAPMASILGRGPDDKNEDGQECVLLRGRAKLLWAFSDHIAGAGARNAPLFDRAWVYQERSLSRRTLAFAEKSVWWTCDESSRGEHPEWGGGGMDTMGMRWTLHQVVEAAANRAATKGQAPSSAAHAAQREALIQNFDNRWHSCVTSYTLCKLTKYTDKLIAVSSIARELALTRVLSEKHYLAGLWDNDLVFQLAWINVEGHTTPPRKHIGDAEYVAPSWSWASIEAPSQPRRIFNSDRNLIALADVLASKVALKTDFAFGSVTGGWLRLRGRLKGVKAASTKALYDWDKSSKSTSLTDETTREKLWFCSDTVEGYELVASRKSIGRVMWMPLTIRFASRTAECNCLVLLRVLAEDGLVNGIGFVKPGEKVYRRLGTGNFGRLPSMLRQDKLLLELGNYPDIQVEDEQGGLLGSDFKREEVGMEEFILI